MGWLGFAVIVAVLLVGAYGLVRLRSHETDSIADDVEGRGPV